MTEEAVLRIHDLNPGKIEIVDPDLADYLRDQLEDGDSEHLPWIPLHHIFRISTQSQSWDWNGSKPEWLDRAIDEANWAYHLLWKGGQRVAWMVDMDTVVVQAPYTVTLSDAINTMATTSKYSSVISGWVINDITKDPEALEDIMLEYDIATSQRLSDALDGRGGWAETLKGEAQDAFNNGLEIPKDFSSGRILKPHQETAVVVLANQALDGQGTGRLLADQVGLGKGGEFICGLLALSTLLESQGEDLPFPCVVAVTKSMKEEIVEEILRWKGDAKIEILQGTLAAPVSSDVEFIVLNHDILAKRLDDLLEAEPRAFIADEAHVYKNPGAKRTQAAQTLADAVRENAGERSYVVLATGTPFLNGPVELWSMLGILGQQKEFSDYAMSKIGARTTRVRTRSGWQTRKIWPQRAFEIRWCGGYYDKFGSWYSNGASNTPELNRLLLRNGMIRRRKSDVMHPLPELQENVVTVEPDEASLAEYQRVTDEFREWIIEEALRVAKEEGMSERAALRIVISKLENGEGMMRMTAQRKALAFAKIEGTVDWIHRFMAGDPEIIGDDPARNKLIVFAHHREPRQALVDHPDLQQYGVVTILAGNEQDGESIQEAKRLFQEDPDTRLIICSMAAREGHTLTAAKDVYLMEIPFVPSWIVQMAGRAWARFSEQYEPHEATVHYAMINGTIDANLLQRVRVKKATFNAVIDGEGQDETIEDIGAENIELVLDALAIGDGELGIAR